MPDRFAACLLLLLPLAACRPPAPAADRWVGDSALVGDTVVVTTHAGSLAAGDSVLDVGPVRVVWQSDSLGRVGLMARFADGMLAVGERDRIHLVEGGQARTIGRRGDGPGEFRAIYGLMLADDTLVVWDAGQRRLTRVGRDGAVHSSTLVNPPGSVANSDPTTGLHDGRLLLAGRGLLTPGTPMRVAVAAIRLDNGDTAVVADVAGETFVEVGGGGLATRDLFGPRGIAAIGAGGRVAIGDGVEYCVLMVRPDAAPRRACRDWERVPVTDAVRHVDFEALGDRVGLDQRTREVATRLLSGVGMGDRRQSWDKLRWGGDGRLWVRVVDSAQADVHPFFLRFAETRPATFRWDALTPDGRLDLQIRVPSGFDPLVFTADSAFGTLELDTGEIVVAAAVLPRDPAEAP